METKVIRALFEYHDWVNGRLIETALTVPAEQTRQTFGASFDSIHGTLAHMLGAEIVWLSRWKGVTPEKLPSGDDFESIEQIQTRWETGRSELWAFIDGLTDARLEDEIEYSNLTGARFHLPLWQMMLHLLNHATHHRSELADMLTRLGSPPPATDLHIFFLEKSGQG